MESLHEENVSERAPNGCTFYFTGGLHLASVDLVARDADGTRRGEGQAAAP